MTRGECERAHFVLTHTFLSFFYLLLGPFGICDVATCAKKQSKKRCKTFVSTFHATFSLGTAELDLHATKSPDVRVYILRNVPDMQPWNDLAVRRQRNRLMLNCFLLFA